MIDESLLKSAQIGRDGFTWWIGRVAHEKHWKDIRKHDDVIYGPLSKKIMENTKKKYENYLKYIPKNNLD